MLNISSHFLYTTVNLLVLFALLRIFLFKPVLRMMDSRSQAIADTIADADAQNEAARQLREDYNAQLMDANAQAQQILSEARRQAEELCERRLEETRQEAERYTAQSRRLIEAERIEMRQQLRREVAVLALAAAAKVSGQRLDSDTDRAMAAAFADQAGDRL